MIQFFGKLTYREAVMNYGMVYIALILVKSKDPVYWYRI